ncbi:hypothetical protein SU69_05655 [Thermosipho melanesiensis]|uniref:Uncharacterized protein n=1 Tax=Thermosipho melanesiensis TaxID=46541 RepID=A0ABN4V123_9BACT|nr:hypothetical protein BW47_05935 [Thermosipho melanesiensis]OOC36008.1 hypothetical protein SU68_05715 [Thermosipho melanesiensis]OOC38147.1 hypothetical protein SU69_05655 [Thermosipho melanesiensis]OOC38276.1 hypothetical protein SU70_05665 [Thermosipho melanesiensis]OOC41376.1 hypothetical protein SU71_05645 [Thermosipho melanesiensis]
MTNKVKSENKKIEKLLKKHNPIYILSYIACFFNFDLNANKVYLLLKEKPILYNRSLFYIQINLFICDKIR